MSITLVVVHLLLGAYWTLGCGDAIIYLFSIKQHSNEQNTSSTACLGGWHGRYETKWKIDRTIQACIWAEKRVLPGWIADQVAASANLSLT
ncbi:hypothetical protein RJT34_19257 [Clitoria ternatea]|uniref:Uncharacterized protein n=1 Tax=Clitoria ternatea TaxID=43366 RepID=A0AAN9P451_CLITE